MGRITYPPSDERMSGATSDTDRMQSSQPPVARVSSGDPVSARSVWHGNQLCYATGVG